MNKNKYIGMMMLAATMLTAASCSDFDDYNKAVSDATASGNQTLWENIQQNTQLSDFKSLVEQAGFSNELNTTHYYTVWAPLNGTFDANSYQSMSKDQLLRLFVKNHIANYSHNATGNLNKRIMMLNEKQYNFTGNSNYQFDGVDVQQANLPSSNGVLHILNGEAKFYPHLYEYVTEPTLSASMGIDSLRKYFLRYQQTYLDADRSVVGPIVDGMQTYVDSVMITTNSLWNSLNIKMLNEDSSYTFLMPTNEAWVKSYDRIKSYYNYSPVVKSEAFVTKNNTVDIDTSNPNLLANWNEAKAAYWQDSIAMFYLTNNLAYSNNDAYNTRFVGKQSVYPGDTIRTTTRNKLSNGTDILSRAISQTKMSNGNAIIVDSLAMLPWETYAPKRTFSAARSDLRARVLQNPAVVRVEDPNPAVVQLEEGETSFSYLWINPSSVYDSPELDLYLPNVLSTTYDIYCVFVPQSASLKTADATTLPNRVSFRLNYMDAAGNLQEKVFIDETPSNGADFMAKFPRVRDNATNHNMIWGYSNDPSKVDTLYIGEFTFPACYYGLGDGYCPNIKVITSVASNTYTRNAFTSDLRIAGFILKPKELVEFEEKNKK